MAPSMALAHGFVDTISPRRIAGDGGITSARAVPYKSADPESRVVANPAHLRMDGPNTQ
jgi:hypothetical protein